MLRHGKSNWRIYAGVSGASITGKISPVISERVF